MKTIIAGSRDGVTIHDVRAAVEACGWTPTVVISGTARGADQIGETLAAISGWPVQRFPADWDKYGKRAGYLRNEEMARNADALVAIWDGKSNGTKHMINIATRAGLRVYVHTLGVVTVNV